MIQSLMNVDKDECRFEWHRILFSDSMLCGALCHPDKVFVFFKKKKKQKKTLVSFLISCYNFSELPMEFYSWN